MRKKYNIFFAAIGFPLLLGAQASGVSAWLEPQETDGKTVVISWCQNNTSSPKHLVYQATLYTTADTTVRSGKTLSLPGQPNLLQNAVFSINDGQFQKITLTITEFGKELAASTLMGPSAASAPTVSPTEQLAGPQKIPNPDELEIEGLVLDETRSKLAHDFYELFYNSWTSSEEPSLGDHTIVIREMPGQIGFGTRIIVEVDGEQLSTLNLQPRAELVENLANQLVESLKEHFLNPQGESNPIQTEDIDGSGVY